MNDFHILEQRTIDSEVWVKIAFFVDVHPSIADPYPTPRQKAVEQWHTFACLMDHARYEAESKLYYLVWPNYCTECDGWGMHCYEFDPSPPGVSLSPGTMTDCDPCTCTAPDNILHARCPRCSARFAYFVDEDWLSQMHDQFTAGGDEQLTREALLEMWVERIVSKARPCPVCGWNWGTGKHDCVPAPPECGCWALSNNPENADTPRPLV